MIAPEKRLSKDVQRWINKQGWTSLREIQVAAINPILSGDQDVVISAATAAGKTEAFFLPACSSLDSSNLGFSILYISPLKALINDQYRRLESLCEMTGFSLVPWHGDVSQSIKTKARKNPHGILLITPESLEAMLMRNVGWMQNAFAHLRYFVIDEFHAFIGTERGQQLISLLDRVQALKPQQIPRIALSATLGDLAEVGQALRPAGGIDCTIIESSGSQTEFHFQLRGYENPDLPKDKVLSEAELNSLASVRVNKDLFKFCRGGFHLVFANSRKNTELISSSLSDLCDERYLPNEFFPHHGSLAKELRESVEKRMQIGKLPTTAICTMTLELGVDIGKVDTVVQVGSPHTVSSLRQRLGRSGRRNTPATLRMLITEETLSPTSSLHDQLRVELVQSIAMIRLLLFSRWYEPPDQSLYHFSTLLHQILALIAQWGGVRADQLFRQLCQKGPFCHVMVEEFAQLLRHMGEIQLITQMSNGELVLGLAGEELVNNYRFYAAFMTPEEFRIISENKTLGMLSVEEPVVLGQLIIFSGRRWKVTLVEEKKRCVYVKPAKGGRPPRFGGGVLSIHKKIREEMFRLYCEQDYTIKSGNQRIDFLNEEARKMFEEGVNNFHSLSLMQERIIETNGIVYILPWDGDKVCFTLMMLLKQCFENVGNYAGVIEVQNVSRNEVVDALQEFIAQPITASNLAQLVPEKVTEKFDHLLPDDLLVAGFAAKFFDIEATKSWLTRIRKYM